MKTILLAGCALLLLAAGASRAQTIDISHSRSAPLLPAQAASTAAPNSQAGAVAQSLRGNMQSMQTPVMTRMIASRRADGSLQAVCHVKPAPFVDTTRTGSAPFTNTLPSRK